MSTPNDLQHLPIERVAVALLFEDPDNAREHGDKNLEAIRASLLRFGQVEPLVVQRRTMRVLGGNGRLRVMRDLGWPAAEVRFVDVEGNEATALALALNRTAELAEWNTDRLAAQLGTLGSIEPALAIGFDAEELARFSGPITTTVSAHTRTIGGSREEGEDVDGPQIEPPKEPVVKPGELWRLGDHVLVCGDSFVEEVRAAALGGEPVDLVCTDPPYAIYGSSTGIGADIADDKMVRPFFEALFKIAKASLKTFGHAYFCTDWRSWASLWEAAKRAQLSAKNCIVWDKGGGGLGANYTMCYELIGFFANLPPPTAMKSTTKRGQRQVHDSNIFRYSRVSGEERQHNAAKPVEMMERLINNSTEEGERVVDFFAGSGSTLIAAERTQRRAIAFEIEPRYCDVIVARWERLTGRRAERFATVEATATVDTQPEHASA